jgi:uncharacterized damage-inducible protein DinB
MYRTIADFEIVWRSESDKTRKIFASLSDSSLDQSVSEGHRSIARVAWHIVTTIAEMMPQTGLNISGVSKKDQVPSTIGEISNAYDKVASELMHEVKNKWDDAALEIVDELYGEKWKRGLTLSILIHHEIHHRGQLTVLMRQANLPVPGIYGPSKEEWANYGGQAPEI